MPVKKSKNEKLKKNKTEKKMSPTTNKKYIMGKVFANWCGACKALKPKWIEMLNQLKISPSEYEEKNTDDETEKSFIINRNGTILEIVQIPGDNLDDYKNKHPELGNLEANGFPTIFRKPDKSPIEYYYGDREPTAMIQWAMGRSNNTIQGGLKHKKTQKHNKSKNHKKSCGACNSGFSQTISNFWGWK